MAHENYLRESLLNAEPISPERQQHFREELAQIMEPRLPRTHRLYYILALVCSVVGILGTAYGLVFDTEHRWTQTSFLLVWTASAGWFLHILRRRAEPLRTMQGTSKAIAGMAAIVAGILIYNGLHSPSLTGVLWALLGLLMFLLTSYINLWNRVATAERTMREHILRVEYRVADLTLRLRTPEGGPLNKRPFR